MNTLVNFSALINLIKELMDVEMEKIPARRVSDRRAWLEVYEQLNSGSYDSVEELRFVIQETYEYTCEEICLAKTNAYEFVISRLNKLSSR